MKNSVNPDVEYVAAKRKYPKHSTFSVWEDNLSPMEKTVIYDNFILWLEDNPSTLVIWNKIKAGENPINDIKKWRVWLSFLTPIIITGILQWLFGTVTALFFMLCLGIPMVLLVNVAFFLNIFTIVQLNKMNEVRKSLGR